MKKILCAIDFSQFAPTVLECAQEMARGMHAELTVFHTVHFPRDDLYHTDAMVERPAKTRRLAEQAEPAMARLMDSATVSWQGRVAVGEPVDQVLKAVDRWGIDLVVAASHGLSGVQRFFLGTVVENLARRLKVPLMVVRPWPEQEKDGPKRPAWSLKTVRVGCRRQARSDPAIAVSLKLARAFQARLDLVHAMAAPPDTETLGPVQAPFTMVQDRIMDRWRGELAALLPETAGASIRLVPGMPGEALADDIEENRSTLIIVGARPRNVWGKLLMGSTTEWVLRHAPCPVLVVPFAESAAGSKGHD